MEIAGNAMENAGKWCKRKVRVRAVALRPERLVLTVEDDGPGLPADRREEVLRRGARLDENAPGSGLGLSIVDELARAYRGSLNLGDSPLGGLVGRGRAASRGSLKKPRLRKALTWQEAMSADYESSLGADSPWPR